MIFERLERIYAEPKKAISYLYQSFLGVKLYKRQTIKTRDEKRAINAALKHRDR